MGKFHPTSLRSHPLCSRTSSDLAGSFAIQTQAEITKDSIEWRGLTSQLTSWKVGWFSPYKQALRGGQKFDNEKGCEAKWRFSLQRLLSISDYLSLLVFYQSLHCATLGSKVLLKASFTLLCFYAKKKRREKPIFVWKCSHWSAQTGHKNGGFENAVNGGYLQKNGSFWKRSNSQRRVSQNRRNVNTNKRMQFNAFLIQDWSIWTSNNECFTPCFCTKTTKTERCEGCIFCDMFIPPSNNGWIWLALKSDLSFLLS